MSPAALVLLCPLTVPGAVVVDGFFTEWKQMEAAGVRLGGGPDLTVELRCARDGKYIHLVVGVRDDRFRKGDTVVVKFGDTVKIEIDPGDLEERMPRAKGLAGVLVDGATRPGGWLLEIALPEAPLRAKGLWRPTGVDAQVTLIDDDGGKDGEDGEVSGNLRFRFPVGADNLDAWMQEAGAEELGLAVLLDIGGDERPEWLIASGNVLGVIGEGLGDVGMSGDVLPWPGQGRIVSISGEDLDGDGTDEVWVRQEIRTDDVRQTVMYLYDWEEEGLSRLVAIEISNEGPGWRVHNKLKAKRSKKTQRGVWAKLAVRAGKPKGVKETTYVDVDAGLDLPYQPLLLPWGFAKKAVYEYETGRYLRVIRD